MKLFHLNCPNCQAELSVKDGIDTFFCTYCGAQLILEGQSDSALNAKVRIKEMEHEERSQEKKYENEGARWNRKHIEKKFEFKKSIIYILLGVAVFVFIMYSPFSFFGSEKKDHEKLVEELKAIELEIENDVTAGNYDEALLKANRLRCDDHWSDEQTKSWNEKREYYINIIEEKKRAAAVQDENSVFVPKSSKDFEKLTIEEAKELLQGVGFTNIETQKVSGNAGFFKKANLVEHILIGGKSEFTVEDVFPSDARIIIYYYES